MKDLLEYKCPCCGGGIVFDNGVQKMKCPHCKTEFDMEALQALEEKPEQELGRDAARWEVNAGSAWETGEDEGFGLYTCQSCGAQIAGDENTAATSCPYCGTPVVMTGRLSGALRPDYVIPFQLDKEAAKEGLRKYLKGKTLLPKVFKEENHIDEIRGVYVPFWLFDAKVEADIRYRASRMRFWSDSKYNYTQTSVYSVVRAGRMDFERVPADGSSQMPDALMESLEPYDFSQAVDFQTAYLAGYLADKYDVTAKESVERANQRIQTSTERIFADSVKGFGTVTRQSGQLRLRSGKASYALYPVWVLNTTWNGQRYTFAMNGQTGKFVGNLPVDKGAAARWFAGISAVAATVFYGLAWLIHLL